MYAFAASIDERKCWRILCLDLAWWREILGGDYLTYCGTRLTQWCLPCAQIWGVGLLGVLVHLIILALCSSGKLVHAV